MNRNSHFKRWQAADLWNEAILMGNGYQGAAIYGHTAKERIQLNDDALWSGNHSLNRINPLAREHLAEIQALILKRQFTQAENLMFKFMFPSPGSMRSYSPLGELDLALNQNNPFTMGWICESQGSEYESDLNLREGILNIRHRQNEVCYQRETFISYPDRVMCISLRSDQPAAINLDMKLNRCPLPQGRVPDDRRPGHFLSAGPWEATRCDSCHTTEDHELLLSGKENGTPFVVGIKVETDGVLEDCYGSLTAHQASQVVIFLSSQAGGAGEPDDETVLQRLRQAARQGYEQVKETHITDFSRLMDRCGLSVPGDPQASLAFQFNRYLLVSASRPGSAAMNLQGIWNSDFNPFFDSKYTININIQMQYWATETCNLAELHQPLFDLLEKMREPGQQVAREMYGCRGMMCHHNTDYFGDCAPQDLYPAACFWPTGGAWLGIHLWEHYRFTQDQAFLARYYPLMNQLALFFVDFLILDPEGYLVTCPSVSPENRYLLEDGSDTPICAGPTLDNQIIRQLLKACLAAASILKLDNPQADAYRRILAKLRPDQIDSQGRLMEWAHEEREYTPDMVHTSHLYGVFPGDEINWKTAPALFQAAQKSLEARLQAGADLTGWPAAWHLALNARFKNRALVGQEIAFMLQRGFTKGLLNQGPIFQIDGNLGLLAGMAECLLQSHQGLDFLPALPPQWPDGQVWGLRARGDITVSLIWARGKLTEAILQSGESDYTNLVVQDMPVISCDQQLLSQEQLHLSRTESGYSIYLAAGLSYHLYFSPGNLNINDDTHSSL
ncbi:glycoside hydrolase family 95 protein [Oscillospiraceae bacterium HV4-5-C5C]|nr:glycoside hydrolase family 95 protein [Oscillospiraceae bacterium HV4-5-C5C]